MAYSKRKYRRKTYKKKPYTRKKYNKKAKAGRFSYKKKKFNVIKSRNRDMRKYDWRKMISPPYSMTLSFKQMSYKVYDTGQGNAYETLAGTSAITTHVTTVTIPASEVFFRAGTLMNIIPEMGKSGGRKLFIKGLDFKGWFENHLDSLTKVRMIVFTTKKDYYPHELASHLLLDDYTLPITSGFAQNRSLQHITSRATPKIVDSRIYTLPRHHSRQDVDHYISVDRMFKRDELGASDLDYWVMMLGDSTSKAVAGLTTAITPELLAGVTGGKVANHHMKVKVYYRETVSSIPPFWDAHGAMGN